MAAYERVDRGGDARGVHRIDPQGSGANVIEPRARTDVRR